MKPRILPAILLAAALLPAAVKSEDGLVYGEAAGQKLTMDYYPPDGPGPHPIAIIIHGGGFVGGTSKNGSEAYCADFLAPAGYAVFSINYRLAPQFPLSAMVEDVHTAVRYIRRNAKKWNADPGRIALVGGSAGGYLSNMAGVTGRGDTAVEAVVTLFGLSYLPAMPMRGDVKSLLGPKNDAVDASPVTHVSRNAPPFLLIHGDKDEAVPFDQSLRMQKVLRAAGVRCDLLVIPNGPHATGSWHRIPGVPDWERQMTVWLNGVLHHDGPVGAGIRER
ncbi:MAG: alpha/beta hydrolase [Acidobacteriota bacterium]